MATEAKETTKQKDQGRRVYRLNADQVLQMIESGIIPDGVDVELWNGVLYKMTKGPGHNYVVWVIGEMLRRVVPQGYHVREEKVSRSGKYSMPEPDVMVIRGPGSNYKRRHPKLSEVVLLVEVCQTTPRADYGTKLRKYANGGVPIYWVVNLQAREVDVFTRPTADKAGPGYAERVTVPEGGELPVVIDGREVARVAAADLFP